MRDIPGARPPAPKDLVRIRDRLTFLYVERCTVHRDSNAITVTDARGVAHVPAAALSVLMIGPGVRVTHSAMSVLSESGATTVWVGENGVRYYAHGVPPSRSSRLLEAQAKAVSDPVLRASVARQMYLMRFQGENVENLSIQQLRGREGARVRRLYRRSSKRTGVPWDGREYVFPARAGMIPGHPPTRRRRLRIPRESGDDPLRDNSCCFTRQYSPRERG